MEESENTFIHTESETVTQWAYDGQKSSLLPSFLICLDCYNKNIIHWVAYKSIYLSLTVLEPGKATIMAPADSLTSESPLPHLWPSSYWNLPWQKGQGFTLGRA